jgi:two-component system, NarL family, sensor kinase
MSSTSLLSGAIEWAHRDRLAEALTPIISRPAWESEYFSLSGDALAADDGDGQMIGGLAKSVRAARERFDRARRHAAIRSLRSPIALFALTGLLAAAVLGAVGVAFTRHQAEQESLRSARSLTRLLAATLEPRFSDALLQGDPAAVAHLDVQVRRYGLVGPIIRIKVWSPSGRIVYSDEPRLVGSVYPLRPDDRAALYSGTIDAEFSDLRRPENRFERGHGRVLEVYMPVKTASGHRLLFETYLRYTAVDATGRQLFGTFAPEMLAGLGLLWLVQLPLAWSLARRLRRHQERHEQLLLHALDASDAERRRIAADLHDTVVQELVGVSYGLIAAGERAGTATPNESRNAFRRAAAELRENMRHLRTLLVEIYPVSAQSAGLVAALEQIVTAPQDADGVRIRLNADPKLTLDPAHEEVVFRTVQEALRNVRTHAHATSACVSLKRINGRAVLTVVDDGVGFDQNTIERRRDEHHFGLELLTDRARRLRGTLSTVSSPGEGTTVRLELPAP